MSESTQRVDLWFHQVNEYCVEVFTLAQLGRKSLPSSEHALNVEPQRAHHDPAFSNTSDSRRGQSGFTLIELLVVTSIIAILGGITVFAVGSVRENAAKNACMTERAAFSTASDVAEFEKADIRDYIKNPSGRYFEPSGQFSFDVSPSSPFDLDCT